MTKWHILKPGTTWNVQDNWGKTLRMLAFTPGSRLSPFSSCFGDCSRVFWCQAVIKFCFSVAFIFTPVPSLLLYGRIVSTTSKFTCNIKGLWSILSCNRCYGIWPLLTALRQVNSGLTNCAPGLNTCQTKPT